jgi:hypothetical protein
MAYNNNICKWSFISNCNNNNNLKLSIILNNEANMLESFFQIFDMANGHFSEFLTN